MCLIIPEKGPRTDFRVCDKSGAWRMRGMPLTENNNWGSGGGKSDGWTDGVSEGEEVKDESALP